MFPTNHPFQSTWSATNQGIPEGNSSIVLGNLTVYMPADHENIINMEKFFPLIKSLTCDEKGLTLAFKDDATFEKAKAIWDWANGAENRSFVMVAGAGDCGWNEDRQPYIIRTLQYDEDGNIAHLLGGPADWETIAHSFDLVVGHVPLPGDDNRAKRDYIKDFSFPVGLSFPLAADFKVDGFGTNLACQDCGMDGSFHVELRISTWWRIPTGAHLRLSPSGLQAHAKVKWSLYGEISDKLSKEWDFPIPIPSPVTLYIPGVVNIGPNFKLVLGIALSEVKAQAAITGGLTATIPDSALIELNLLNPAENQVSSWIPDISVIPFTVDARITAKVEAYVAPTLSFDATALGMLTSLPRFPS